MIVAVAGLAIAAWLCIPAVSDLLALARARRRARPLPPRARPNRICVLVPAHNEERLIESCIRSLTAMHYPQGSVHIVVVADNCTDRTAKIARDAGVACLERTDSTRRGKPFAIAWALEHLALARWDAVVICDADVVVDAEFAAELDRAGSLRNMAVQPFNDVRNPGDSMLTMMSAVFAAGRFHGAFSVKTRAGLNVPLSAGMCIGTNVLAAHPWESHGLSEDWDIYARLTAAGVTVTVARGARIRALETSSLRDTVSQRRRWSAGRLMTLVRVGPTLLRSTRAHWHQKLDALGELSAPGPVVHLAIATATAAVVSAAGAPLARTAIGLFALSLVRPVAYAVVGVRHSGDRTAALRAFAALPVYAAWRATLAVATLGGWIAPREWRRSTRPDADAGAAHAP